MEPPSSLGLEGLVVPVAGQEILGNPKEPRPSRAFRLIAKAAEMQSGLSEGLGCQFSCDGKGNLCGEPTFELRSMAPEELPERLRACLRGADELGIAAIHGNEISRGVGCPAKASGES